jgi:pSer/pThr/pTyr-binding forkhead associated (FHA) protein
MEGRAMADQVEVWVRDNRTGQERTLWLGEFRAVWSNGVTIGRDPDCDVVLDDPEVAPRHAELHAVSNHKYLRVLDGATVQSRRGEVPAGGDIRVDGSEFHIGPFTVRLLGAGC